MTSTSWNYTITFLSDWHIGSGVGIPGSVDRLVVRHPEDDLPYVPATTVTGMWRDACELVAAGLGQGWDDWVTALFGVEPRPGSGLAVAPAAKRLAIGAARLPGPLREALKGRLGVRAAVTHVLPGVEIDPRSGRARDEHLRFVEVSRAGAMLDGILELDGPADLEESGSGEEYIRTVKALLQAGASWIDRVGGKRRRGWGRCVLRLNDALPDADAVTLLDRDAPPVPQPQGHAWTVAPDTPVTNSHEDKWRCWDVDITALSPLVIGHRQIGNLIETRREIPGSLLLPVVLRAMRRTDLDVDAAARNGHLIVTDACPHVAPGNPGRPAPRCLVRDKKAPGLGGEYLNHLVELAGEGLELVARQAPSGAYVGRFGRGDTTLPTWGRPRTGTTTHNSVDDTAQRPVGPGGLYSYEWLAPGTRFRCQVRVRDGLAAALGAAWTTLLCEQGGRVGRSRRDEYGQVAIEVRKGTPEIPVLEEDNLLFVWLLSDVLLRDQHLRPDASELALRRALSDALDVQLEPHAPVGRGHAMIVPARRESWSERWGLARPSLCGLGAGSVAVYRVQLAVEGSPARIELQKRLTALASSGLGERRAEGFGQLSFNDPLVRTPLAGRGAVGPNPGNSPDSGPLMQPDDAGYDVAMRIEREAWRDEIARAAEQRGVALAEALGFTHDKPGAAQLGALRIFAGSLFTADVRAHTAASTRALAWLDHVKKSSRHDLWRRSLGELQALFGNPDRVWTSLFPTGIPSGLHLTQDAEHRLREELWGEAVHAMVVESIRAVPKPRKGSKPGKRMEAADAPD